MECTQFTPCFNDTIKSTRICRVVSAMTQFCPHFLSTQFPAFSPTKKVLFDFFLFYLIPLSPFFFSQNSSSFIPSNNAASISSSFFRVFSSLPPGMSVPSSSSIISNSSTANSSSSSSNPPACCSSSSSDEEVHLMEGNGGWPSVVSVLETPDRRRVRKSLRLVRTMASSTDGDRHCQFPQHGGRQWECQQPFSSVQSSKFTPVTHSSSSIGHKRGLDGNALSQHSLPPPPPPGPALFNSPPICQRPLGSFSSSPILQTPHQSSSSSLAIHLSASPLRSFFIRQGRQRAIDSSPRSSKSAASSSSSTSSPFSILRPLNLHNYIGVRFTGDQPEQLNRTKIVGNPNREREGLQNYSHEQQQRNGQKELEDENAFGDQKKKSTPLLSPQNDSGFFDFSNSSSSSSAIDISASSFLRNSAKIETPSKGLARCQFQSCSIASTSSFHHSHPSAVDSLHSADENNDCPLQHSPIKIRPFPAPLLLEFNDHFGQLDCPSSSSFHSPIPEQSFGPLEASVLNGILNDLDKMQHPLAAVGTSTRINGNAIQSSHHGNHLSLQKSPIKCRANLKSSPRSSYFERKLQILRRKRESPRLMKKQQKEWWKIGKRKPIPASLFVEGMNEEYLGERTLSRASNNKELALLFPKTDTQQWLLMFGQTEDQLEVTKQAHQFLKRHAIEKNTKGNGVKMPIKIGFTKSAGLPAKYEAEIRINIDS